MTQQIRETKKICIKCNEIKVLTDFFIHKEAKDKRTNVCKKCRIEHQRRHMKLNRKRWNQYKTDYFEKYPWKKTYHMIRARCKNNKYYIAKGIKNLITAKELKKLWFRDKAYLLECPSIDRINPKGNYVLGNCRYIELIANIKRQRKGRTG